jgi:hypothetical protein
MNVKYGITLQGERGAAKNERSLSMIGRIWISPILLKQQMIWVSSVLKEVFNLRYGPITIW